jgi:hypothetical protein
LHTEHRRAIAVQKIESVAMPGTADAVDLARIDPGLLDAGPDGGARIGP